MDLQDIVKESRTRKAENKDYAEDILMIFQPKKVMQHV